jgi:gamma-glutamylputrescine oxidase
MMQASIWEKESFYEHKDVLIVGSGFVGLWCAYYLKKKHPKLRIAIVERGIIPTGASTRNAGFACFGSLTELVADNASMGEPAMLELVQMRYRGLERIRKVFSDKEIGYEPSGGYELITEGQLSDFNTLRTHVDQMNQKLRPITGQSKAFILNDGKIESFGFSGLSHLIENRLEGQLHSGKLCQSLLRLVQSMGVTLMNAVDITGFAQSENLIELTTNQSFLLSASQLLICTNAFAKQLLPDLDVEPARGQVLVTSPISGLRFRGTFHYDEGFYYFRNLGKRILLGGARNKAMDQEHTLDFSTSDFIQKELEGFLKQTVLGNRPTEYTVEYRWSGPMGIGRDKRPLVQQISPNVFCAVRMGGMGVALAPEIGKSMATKMRD